MRNIFKFITVIAFTVMITFTLVSCGGGSSPKALAKQTVDLTLELWSSVFDLEKTEKLTKEFEVLEAKVKKLSPTQTLAYQIELARLMATVDSSKYEKALESATTSLQQNSDFQDLVKGLETVSSNMESASKELGATTNINSYSQDLNEAMSDLQKALEELKSLGFEMPQYGN